MSTTNIFLTGLGDWWAYILAAAGGILTLWTFWAKLRDSVMGRLISENRRLKGLLGKMTIEETLKIDIIADLERQKKDLETEILRRHREQVRDELDELKHTADSENPNRR